MASTRMSQQAWAFSFLAGLKVSMAFLLESQQDPETKRPRPLLAGPFGHTSTPLRMPSRPAEGGHVRAHHGGVANAVHRRILALRCRDINAGARR